MVSANRDKAIELNRYLTGIVASVIPILLVGAVLWHLRSELNWRFEFEQAVDIGQSCQAGVEKLEAGSDFVEISQLRLKLSPATMPYRGTSFNPEAFEDRFLRVACEVDLTRFKAGDFVWLALGSIMGSSAIWLDDRLLFETTRTMPIGFPVPPELLGQTRTLTILSKGTKEGRPGPASLIPMVLVDSPEKLARIQYAISSWTTDQPMFRFGIALALSFTLAVLWLLGLRYADLSAMILFGATVSLHAYLSFRMPGMSLAHSTMVFAAGVYAALLMFMCCFVLRFCRVSGLKGIEVGALLIATAYGLVCWRLEPRVFFEWRLFAKLPSQVGAGVLFAACAVGLSHLRSVETIAKLRLWRMTAVCAIGLTASVALFFQSSFEDKLGVALTPFTSIVILLLFTGIMVHDLVIHQRGYFIERLERQRAEDTAKADRALAHIMQMIAHDIRRPLSFLRKLIGERVEVSAGQTEATMLIQLEKSIQSTEALVTDITDASSYGRPITEEVRLARLVEGSYQEACNYAERSAGEFRCEISDDLQISGDSRKLQRVFVNLLQNALEAIDPANAVIWVKAEHVIGQDFVEIEVGNTGSFIPSEVRLRIFERFYSHNKSGGTGLGLAAVRQIVANHGGEIKVESDHATGTRFILKLPLAKPRGSTFETMSDSGWTFVLAEDSFYVAQSWLESFAGEDFRHYISPEELLKDWRGIVATANANLVLITDYYFTHASELLGPELVMKLREINPKFSVVLASDASVNLEESLLFLTQITKEPIAPDQLRQMILSRPVHNVETT